MAIIKKKSVFSKNVSLKSYSVIYILQQRQWPYRTFTSTIASPYTPALHMLRDHAEQQVIIVTKAAHARWSAEGLHFSAFHYNRKRHITSKTFIYHHLVVNTTHFPSKAPCRGRCTVNHFHVSM